jgi:N-acyl-phosphatidylethanolamine-hydrolysing phospholipase D
MVKTRSSPIKYCTGSYQFGCVVQLLTCTAISTFLFGCANVNAQYNPAKPHHTTEGFKNNYSNNIDKSTGDFLRWQYERVKAGLPKPPEQPAPMVAPDLAFIHANAKPAAMQPAIT